MANLQQILGVDNDYINDSLISIQEAIEFNRKKDQSLRLHERLMTIFLLLLGKSISEIILLTGISKTTLYNYASIYKVDGLDGLTFANYKGSEPHLTKEQEELVIETIETKTPVDEGFEIEMNWTSKIIRDLIEDKFGVSYSDRGVRNLLDRLGFSYTKPTYHLAKADPEKQKAFKEAFERVKKNF